ncbi:TetR/AcrR family transcriptional regulator [Corynebacterium xerosis]|uniref:TetR/AcrR family transcriptional regulator n=1 Tax=Corynebacterium xerosis TaxID=1725 RepID=A0A2N6SXC3_9CORY|nr:TetR/AcrR family transcriptional regulator [Corynebacterium xerosis]PMC61723.1 TetR/AcrR family transcriptional regulator [Corynebacterium xerosis]
MTMPNDAPQPDARTRILACSRELFSQRSFAHVSLRDIASAAGVSSALIIKHFHSREQLFERTVDFTDSSSALFSGPFDQLGMTSVLETISAPDNAPYSTIRVLTVTDGEESLGAIGRRIKEDLLHVLARRIAKEAPHASPSPDLRAQSAMAVLAGLSFMRRVGDVDFAAFDRTELIDHYAEIIQRIVDGEN